MEYCNTYGILKYCSIKDHLRMQQRELGSVLGLGMWRAVSYLCILQSWSGLSTAVVRCVAGENQFGTVENLSAVYFQFSSKLLSLSRHLAPIPFADNYFSLEITLTTYLLDNTCLKYNTDVCSQRLLFLGKRGHVFNE